MSSCDSSANASSSTVTASGNSSSSFTPSASSTTSSGGNKSRSTRGGNTSRTRFLRGVLDGWKSVASASITSLDSPISSSVASTSHSSSCGHLVTGSASYDDSYVPSSDDIFYRRNEHQSSSDEFTNRSGRFTPVQLESAGGGGGGTGGASSSPGTTISSSFSSNTTALAGSKHNLIFNHQVTCLAYDPIQRVFAIGYSSGHLRLLPLVNHRGSAGSTGPGDNVINSSISNRWTSSPFGCNNLGSTNQVIDCHTKHPSGQCINQILFIINDGTLITRCDDGCIYHWSWKSNLTKSSLELLTSTKLTREKASYIYLPFQSKWLYIGTDRGNILFASTEKMSNISSSYTICWNKCIDSLNWNKVHPGSINFICDSPNDPNKLFFTFDSYSQLICWDFKLKCVDYRIIHHEPMTHLSWHHEGKQFMCSHSDGSLTTWSIKVTKPVAIMYPHARHMISDLKIEPCNPIYKMDLKTSKSTEPFVVFTGGLATSTNTSSASPGVPASSVDSPVASGNINLNQQQIHQQTCPSSASSSSSGTSTPTSSALATSNTGGAGAGGSLNCTISIIHGESTQIIQLKSAIVDFVTLCESPHNCDFNEPFAVAILLSNDLLLLDLSQRKTSNDDSAIDSVTLSSTSTSASGYTSEGAKYQLVNILPDEIELLSSHTATSSLFNSTREMPKLSLINRFFINTNITSSSTTYDDLAELFISNIRSNLNISGGSLKNPSNQTSASSSGCGTSSSSTSSSAGAPGGGSSSSLLDTSRLTAGSLAAEVMKAKVGFIERGEKLEQLEDRTARMANEAEGFRDLSHQLLNKYKDKKWYQF